MIRPHSPGPAVNTPYSDTNASPLRRTFFTKTPEAISVVLTQTVVRGGADVPATAPSSFYLPQKGSECRSAGKEKPGIGPDSLSARHTVRTGFVDKIDRERHIREVTLPSVQPIIPTWRKEPFDGPEWLFEFKYDGFRGLFYLEQGRCRFISRNGNVMSRFEVLGDQVAAVLDVDEAIIDGEVIAVDETGRPQFYELLRVPRSASYVAFDILWLNGADLRSLPLAERRRRLEHSISSRATGSWCSSTIRCHVPTRRSVRSRWRWRC